MALLQLTWYEEGVAPTEPTVLCGTCAMGQKTVDNAGKAFWEKFEFPLCPETTKLSNTVGEEEKEKNGDSAQNDREAAYKEKRAKRAAEQQARDGGLLKMSEDLKGKDLYELLDVEPGCSNEDIKKAYRKMALLHHPDKMKDPTEEQQKHFVIIQEAHDILSDPVKRRRFESTLKFDDAIPSDRHKGYADNFFEVFSPVFKRNGRWSSKPRVPELGDEATAIETVKSFYEFWRNFDSWRDPLAMAEKKMSENKDDDDDELHKLEDAECREEKRWMERENAKVARKIKTAERQRVSDLVKNAEKHDPRMIAHRAELAAGKEAEKARKQEAEAAEKTRLEAAAREAAEAAEATRAIEMEAKLAEKKGKEETKNALKSARQRVRNLHKNGEAAVRRAVHIDQLQEVCLRLGTEELQNLASDLEGCLAKEGEDCSKTVELLHAEIKKYGATPIEDDSVQLKPEEDSDSTATPVDSCNEEQRHEPEGSPEKIVNEPTAEELEAERVLAESQEAEELARKEKKAEEQRKKRDQKKREDEKRAAASNRSEAAQRAKERKAQEKAVTKEAEKEEPKSVVPKAKVTYASTGISKNVILVVIEESVVFASPESSDEISNVSEGSFLVAAGPPVEVDGFPMVPLQPCGSIELSMVKTMVAPKANAEVEATEEDVVAVKVAPVKTAAKAAKPVEEDLDDILNEMGITPQPATKSPKGKKGKK